LIGSVSGRRIEFIQYVHPLEETGSFIDPLEAQHPNSLVHKACKHECQLHTTKRKGSKEECSYSQPQSIPVENEFYAELLESIAYLEARLASTERANTLGPDPQSTGSRGLKTQSTQLETPLDCHCGRQISRDRFSLHYNPNLHWIVVQERSPRH